ncbi:MAG TPA: exodeoxyribonuclease VII large subunit [Chthoniobacteraceae bacterium]|jgi:exodeoxyribonuclease VII large subunit|nr:exodeoxyribonuclease VII large subunit [Chthoniobacteraceae bacterium]
MEDFDLFSYAKASGGKTQPPEPPPEPAQPRIWSVAEITRSVRITLENAMGEVWVQGEICNFRRQSSGHCYFGLKDEKALLSCVLFRSSASARVDLADGMQVQAHGRVTVYEARGQYQLIANLIQPAGAGLLQARFEALKRKLEAEGLFDPARKRPIPGDPRCIGIVTSPTGAALQDFLNIACRRAPWARIIINPVRVQGAGAAAEIAAAIHEFNLPMFEGVVDLLVVCRGGGSMEDLWAFNEEIVARAIAASRLPVISAVGHEIDFTIADFVADLRAPTPSAAAELALPDRVALSRHLQQGRTRLQRAIEAVLAHHRRSLDGMIRSAGFRAPQRLLQDRAQRLDAAASAIELRRERAFRLRHDRLAAAIVRLRHYRPDQVLALRRLALAAARTRLQSALAASVTQKSGRIARLAEMLRILSPEATLGRGYSITFDAAGHLLRSAGAAKTGDLIRTRLSGGDIASRVE